MKHQPFERPGTLILGLALLLNLVGCGIIHREPVPSPYSDVPGYGEVVREIRLEGNNTTREHIVLNTMVTRVGSPYTQEAAEKDYRRILQLGVFTSIRFETEPAQDGIALVIKVRENSPYIPMISMAITQENGLEIGPGLVSPNLFGLAAKASVSARFGGATNIGARFADPWRMEPTWYKCCYDVQYFQRDRNNDLDDFDEVSDEIYFQWLYFLNEKFHFGPRANFIHLRAKTEMDSLGVDVTPDVILDPSGNDDIPGLGLVAEFDTRNLISYPTQGWYGQLSGLQYGGFLGGASDYFRLEADLRKYTELSGPKHSLAFYSFTSLTTGLVDEQIPIHQDFHVGGTNSVRGWPLGARVGKSQWLNTAEYWWNILPREQFRVWFIRWSMGLQLAAFADAGTAWNNSEEFHDNWIGGGGVGARLTIPQIGLVRFDVGMGQKEGARFNFFFQVGGSEKAYAQKKRVR